MRRWCTKKSGGQEAQALGRSRGGFSTKIHIAVDALGNPLRLLLTAGQRHDSPQASALIENFEPQALIADKGYDSDTLLESVTVRGILAVIPPKKSRLVQREYDQHLYRGWTMATIAEYSGGRPFNQLAGFDRNRNGDALSDRPAGVGRNQGILTNLFNLDLRLSRRLSSKHLKFDAIFDVFNLFNRANVLEIQNVANQPGFGSQPLRLVDPRRIQLGMRVQF